MKRTLAALVIGAAFLFGFNVMVNAQGDAAETKEGSVTSVSDNLLVINPKGIFSNELQVEVNQNTQLEGAASVQELQPGDEVRVEYFEDEGRNLASRITKVAESEDTGSQNQT